MRKVCSLVVLLLLFGVSQIKGQELESLTHESRVRIVVEGNSVEGRWAGLDDEQRVSVLLRGSLRTFERDEIQRIEMWRPSALSGAGTGLLYGLLVGAGVGLALDFAYSEDQLGEGTFLFGGIGAVTGAAIGLVVGQVRGTWYDVEF